MASDADENVQELTVAGSATANPSTTFKHRVPVFWQWFETQADRFYKIIDDGQCASLADEVGQFVDQTLPGLSWVFGPGENGGHSFTISGEGIIAKQVLAAYWLAHAPEIRGWDFYSARQPTSADQLQTLAIGIGPGESIDAASFQIATTPDEEAEQFDIVAWHPMLEQVAEDDRLTILFLLLDEALGEFGTEQWLGSIELKPPAADAKTMMLTELPKFLEQAQRYHEWQKLPPLHSYSSYQTQEQESGPRGDTIVGTTLIPHVIIDFIREEGAAAENLLEGSGAELVYLRFLSANLPEGQEADARGNLEDAIDDALRESSSGRTLGGAYGVQQSYIDLILLDGENSRSIVRNVVDTLQLKGDVAIENLW